MAAEELVIINVFGETRPLIEIDPNWKDRFNQYQNGFEAAPDKLEYNRQMMRKIRERHFTCIAK